MANTAWPFENENNEKSIVEDSSAIIELSPTRLIDTSKKSQLYNSLGSSSRFVHRSPTHGKDTVQSESAEKLQQFENLSDKAGEKIENKNHIKGIDSLIATEETVKSIFDLSKDDDSPKSPILPQILTVFASQADKSVLEKEAKNCILPPIQVNRQQEISVENKSNTTQGKKTKRGLFDYRERATQEKARTKHIRRLQRRGYEVTAHPQLSNSRFISNPYEGAIDDYTVTKSKYKTTSDLSKCPEATLTKSKSHVVFSPPADEHTLTKIEAAFAEWTLRKEKSVEKHFGCLRRRSSSHSPPRSTPQVCLLKLSASCSNSVDFLNHSGNIRRPRKPDSGRKYKAIGSPTVSRSFPHEGSKKTPRRNNITTTIPPLKELSTKERFEGRSSAPIPSPAKNRSSHFPLKNKRLSKIQSGESIFSTSLPNLHSDSSDEMEAKSYRPRSSSLKKARPTTPAKSPKPQRRGNSKTGYHDHDITKKDEKISRKEGVSTVTQRRRVTLNTCLPTGSPSFQRAMKTMQIPDKEYSEIFGQKRRDSILQKYTLAESALNSFRDDNDMKTIESSSNALDKVTVRFQEDLRLFKEESDQKKKETKRKSILKKRRRSVDDLDVGTRKNLAKYLESKLEVAEK